MLHSKDSRHWCYWLAAISAVVVLSCRPSEPEPAYNEDLGTEEAVLLPPSSAWHHTAVAKGQADWRPFRKPDADAKPGDAAVTEAKPAGGNQAIESELRGLVDDFNAAVAESKFEDAMDFLVEEQTAPAKQVVEVWPTYSSKIQQVVEVLPGINESIKTAVAGASLPAILKLEVASIVVSSPTEAVGKSASTSGAAADVRFVLVKDKEDEYWYIDHPQIRAIGPALPALQQSLPQLDALIAGAKSGQIPAEALAQQAAAMNQMIGAMLPAGSQPSKEPKNGEPDKPGENG